MRSCGGALGQAGVPAAPLATTRALHEEGFSAVPFFADRIVSFHIFDFSRRAFKPPEREVIPLGRYVFCLSTAEWVAVRAHTRVRVAACLFWLKLRSISGCDRAAGGEQICDCKSTPLSRSTSQITYRELLYATISCVAVRGWAKQACLPSPLRAAMQ